MLATMIGRQRKFYVSDGLKKPKECQKLKLLAKHFFQYFQIFFIFIYNESLLIKSDQFFKIYKRFFKEREKTVIQQSMQPLEMAIDIFSSIGLFVHKIFFILQAPSQRKFSFLTSGCRKKYQKGKLGTTNSQEQQITIFISKIISIFQ